MHDVSPPCILNILLQLHTQGTVVEKPRKPVVYLEQVDGFLVTVDAVSVTA